MIDFDLLITYRHQEFLIEKNMENESATDEDKFESYVNPDGPMAQAGFLEDEPLHSDNDNWKEEIDHLNETSNVNYSDDIPF